MIPSADSKPDLYGMAEIADALADLGVKRPTVVMWRQRGFLPQPDGKPSGTPAWKPETIEPWIRAKRVEMGEEMMR